MAFGPCSCQAHRCAALPGPGRARRIRAWRIFAGGGTAGPRDDMTACPCLRRRRYPPPGGDRRAWPVVAGHAEPHLARAPLPAWRWPESTDNAADTACRYPRCSDATRDVLAALARHTRKIQAERRAHPSGCRGPSRSAAARCSGSSGRTVPGKTTTVRTLGTLIASASGSATVAGIPLTPENGVEIPRRIAIMPESPGLYLRLSVAENLECFADLCEAPDPKDRIDGALRAVGLAGRARDACGTLSKGLRQRVALARAPRSARTMHIGRELPALAGAHGNPHDGFPPERYRSRGPLVPLRPRSACPGTHHRNGDQDPRSRSAASGCLLRPAALRS